MESGSRQYTSGHRRHHRVSLSPDQRALRPCVFKSYFGSSKKRKINIHKLCIWQPQHLALISVSLPSSNVKRGRRFTAVVIFFFLKCLSAKSRMWCFCIWWGRNVACVCLCVCVCKRFFFGGDQFTLSPSHFQSYNTWSHVTVNIRDIFSWGGVWYLCLGARGFPAHPLYSLTSPQPI